MNKSEKQIVVYGSRSEAIEIIKEQMSEELFAYYEYSEGFYEWVDLIKHIAAESLAEERDNLLLEFGLEQIKETDDPKEWKHKRKKRPWD